MTKTPTQSVPATLAELDMLRAGPGEETPLYVMANGSHVTGGRAVELLDDEMRGHEATRKELRDERLYVETEHVAVWKRIRAALPEPAFDDKRSLCQRVLDALSAAPQSSTAKGEDRAGGEPKPVTEELSQRILKVIVAELGGYEATHAAISGCCAAIHARVMIELSESARPSGEPGDTAKWAQQAKQATAQAAVRDLVAVIRESPTLELAEAAGKAFMERIITLTNKARDGLPMSAHPTAKKE